jgi:hypothetical protein
MTCWKHEHRSGLLESMLMVSLSTGIAHIATADGESACGRFEYDFDRVHTETDRIYYETRYRGNTGRGLIHTDDTWTPHRKSLCYYCDQGVPDEIQSELFDDEKFEYIDRLTVSKPTPNSV